MLPHSKPTQPQRGAGFSLDETGSLTIFSMFIIILMFIAGGMAVDFMRQESARARTQGTLDRAVLAAADLDQKLTTTAVVKDYFTKAGLDPNKVTVKTVPTLTARNVSAVANDDLNSFFLRWLGINKMPVPAAGAAEESISNIEISMVLDVSGSMSEPSATPGMTKLQSMQKAAGEFVDTIFAQTMPGRTSISVVPYSTQVNAGASILKYYNVTSEHAYSNCVDFKKTDYSSPTISTTDELRRTGNFDPITTLKKSWSKDYWKQTPGWRVCRFDAGMEILPFQNNKTAIKNRINSLVSQGYTSIEIGVKWGAALLDKAAQPVVTGLIADGIVPSGFAGRPAAQGGSTMKVIVVLTDGINTNQWFLSTKYDSGLSDSFYDYNTAKFSIKGPENGDQDGDGKSGEMYFIPSASGGSRWSDTPSGGTDAKQLTYPELWDVVGVEFHAYYNMYAMTGDWNTYLEWSRGTWDADTRTSSGDLTAPGVYSRIGGSEKDIRLDSACTAAKNNEITIYAIGFEVTDDSATVMKKCASTPDGHFFRVDGTTISQAFKAIANDIGKLRLTQ